MRRFPIAVLACLLVPTIHLRAQAPAQSTGWFEISTALMEATLKLEGRDDRGQSVFGTGFLLGRPFQKEPTKSRYVLITAAHVFDEMKGDVVVVHSRRRVVNDNWVRVPFPIAVRANGRELFTRLPDADVAVMYVNLPSAVQPLLLPTTLLADDEDLRKFEIHPGDELLCLGYPLAQQSNSAGFPILRSAKIASFPLLPTDTTKVFLFDFKVFKGNSGGPVYFVSANRYYQGSTRLGEQIHLILGLVSKEGLIEQQITGPYSQEIRQLQLDLGVVVHASQIKKAINLLPPPDGVP